MDPGSGLVNDLATLSDLDEEILLQELRARYERDVIYTNVGDILIAVNPYRPLPIYGQDVAERYSNVSRLSSQLPHVFAVADRAYRTLCLTATNQCCVVSGESGAGKTETTKLLVQHIAFQCRYQRSDLHTRIVQVNPLLEAFGNAETLMNKNSSRFGKYIELSFTQDGSLYRAKLDEYLLEKSRVVSQGNEEKNFHVFYAMFAGLTSFELRKLVLEPPDNYRILNNQSGGPVYPNEDVFLYHKEEYARLYRVMEAVGFYPEDITMIYALLGAVLHVANIDFVSEEDNEGVYIINEYELDIASSLLGLNTEDLVSVLISNTSTVRGERIVSLKSLHQANDGRDALAKAVYSRLFSWIVRQINLMLDPIEDRPFVDKKDLRHIGILDMAGFENFPTNSFEQLCINVANEQLQFYFNQHVFAWEVQAYANEGIRHPKIKYNNNKPLLDLFLERPLGLLCLLDEECKFPRATDTTLVDKLNKNLSKSSHYKKSKHRELAFSIQHYAGPVKYQATGFLEKNRDTLSLNLIEILQKSASWIVHELFTARLSDTGTLDVRAAARGRSKDAILECKPPDMAKYAMQSLSRKASKKLKQKMKQSKGFLDSPPPSQATASLHFRNSLTDLTEKLLQADPQFIRCIKPNAVKSPSHFVPGIVLDQLRYTGVLETTRIRRNGFPTRLPFQTFLQRYGLIAFPVLPPPRESGEECAAVLHRAGIDHWQIGKTKVFLKYWHTEKLNMGVQKCLDSVKTIQNSVRTLVARKALKRLRLKSHKQAQEVELFCVQVQQQLDNIHTMLTEQQQQDAERHQRMLESRYPRNNQPIRLPGLSPDFDDIDSIIGYDKSRYYEVDNRPASEPVNIQRQPPPVAPRPKIFRTTDEFTQVVVDDIVDRRPTLNDGIWCKVLYMERNHLVAKFYVEEPDISIDGSEEKYAGERVGLGYFKNARRDELTTRVRNEISRGIELRQDNEGSIIATRLGYADVVVSGYKEPQNHCLCRDLILNRGRLQYNTPVKIFDMKEFKSHIALELRHGTVNRDRLRRLCLVNLSFMTDIDDILQSPCWMCVVNLTAFDSIHSPAVIREVRSSLISLVQQKSREEVNQNNQKRDSRAWSKVNQRPSSNITDIPRRNQKTARKINQAILHPRPTSPASVSSSSDSFDFHSSRDFFANLEDGRSASPSVSSNIKPLPRNNWAKLKALQKLQEEEASGKGHRSRKH